MLAIHDPITLVVALDRNVCEVRGLEIDRKFDLFSVKQEANCILMMVTLMIIDRNVNSFIVGLPSKIMFSIPSKTFICRKRRFRQCVF